MRLLLHAVCTVAVAQPAVLTGIVADPDGGTVKDAVVQAKSSATGAVVRTNSSAKGEYHLNLPSGSYDLAVPMPCCQYGSFAESNITVKPGESRLLDIHLPWGSNLGAIGDDPILLLNAFRERAAVPSGRAPRTPEGKPDLTGIWINVYNPDTPPPSLKPWAAEILRQRMANNSKDYPGAYCMPANAAPVTRAFPYKFVQTPSLIVVLHESDTPGVRQIFLDGRGHPEDMNPTWEGHSIGHWEGDTLVVDTAGYNDRSWLSLSGIPHTERLHTVERIRRPDYGHIEIEITMEDSESFTGAWRRAFTATLAPPDEEIMEFVCSENNRDVNHYQAK
ncbi:MAG TPA: carboxypeptidase-like regulatory domain-containing protein [Bryobacteraceae bacterium]|nr:carboxypeptidase-like regulatory domain-containing protein [Bryobacteraceae bacterium]